MPITSAVKLPQKCLQFNSKTERTKINVSTFLPLCFLTRSTVIFAQRRGQISAKASLVQEAEKFLNEVGFSYVMFHKLFRSSPSCCSSVERPKIFIRLRANVLVSLGDVKVCCQNMIEACVIFQLLSLQSFLDFHKWFCSSPPSPTPLTLCKLTHVSIQTFSFCCAKCS